MSDKTAIILGASGSVGQALLAEIVRCGQFNRVVALTRQPLDLPRGGVVEERLLPDMAPPCLTQAVVEVLNERMDCAVGFSVLGVGADTAKLSLAAHRAIDVDLNAALAKGLKNSGKAEQLAFMSAIGADIHARASGSGAAGMGRYNRVKGEAEAAVLACGPAVVSIFRPALIIGSQHTPSLLAMVFTLLSPLMPKKYRPIRTNEIAQAMVAVTLSMPSSSTIYCFSEMQKLISAAPNYFKPESLLP